MKRNIPVQLLHIVENLFTGCLTSIKWYDTWSAEFMIEFGVTLCLLLSLVKYFHCLVLFDILC